MLAEDRNIEADAEWDGEKEGLIRNG